MPISGLKKKKSEYGNFATQVQKWSLQSFQTWAEREACVQECQYDGGDCCLEKISVNFCEVCFCHEDGTYHQTETTPFFGSDPTTSSLECKPHIQTYKGKSFILAKKTFFKSKTQPLIAFQIKLYLISNYIWFQIVFDVKLYLMSNCIWCQIYR